MITPLATPWQPELWSRELNEANISVAELVSKLKLAKDDVDLAPEFKLKVPPAFLKKIMLGDRNDPLLRQILPRREENELHPGFVPDPLDEQSATKTPSLIQKYHGRSLLITTPTCAVHCRYCFRRHFPYADNRPSQHEAALAAIACDTSITELILSGGDPLVLTDKGLHSLLERAKQITHLRRLRIHTRLPIVIPARITEMLLTTLSNLPWQVCLVVHSNHANELDENTARAFGCLQQAGVTLLNQSVLLHGINDDAAILANLSEKLYAQRVLPYYLHLPDPVTGTQHFFVTKQKAKTIHHQLCELVPGYLAPRLVQEQPGLGAKQIVSD